MSKQSGRAWGEARDTKATAPSELALPRGRAANDERHGAAHHDTAALPASARPQKLLRETSDRRLEEEVEDVA